MCRSGNGTLQCSIARAQPEPGIVGQDSGSEGAHRGEAKPPLIDISTFPLKLARANKLSQFDNATTIRDSSAHTERRTDNITSIVVDTRPYAVGTRVC